MSFKDIETNTEPDEKTGWQYFREEMFLTYEDKWQGPDDFFNWYINQTKEYKDYEYKSLEVSSSLITGKMYVRGDRKQKRFWLRKVITNDSIITTTTKKKETENNAT